MGGYALNFPVIAGDPKPLKDIAAAAQEIGTRVKLSAGEFKLFSDELNRGLAAGKKYSDVLREIARDFQNSTPKLRDFTRELAEQAAGLKATASAASNAKTEFLQLQKVIFGFNPRLGGVAGLAGSLGGGLGAGIAVGGAAAIGGIVETVRKLAEYGREMTNLAARTGLTVQQTERFAAVAEIAGVNISSLVTAQRTLSRAMAQGGATTRQAQEALKELGLSAQTAFEKPQKALSDILDALGRVESATERERLTIALLGRGGLELLPLAGQFKELQKQTEGLAIVMDDKAIAAANRMAQAFSLLKLQIKGVAIEAAALILGFDQSKTGTDALRLGTGYGARYRPAPGAGTAVYSGGASESLAAHRGYQTSQRIQSVLRSLSTPEERYRQEIQNTQGDLDAAINRNDLAGVTAAKRKLELLEQQNKALKEGETIEKRRAELEQRLLGEGAKPGALARFQYQYRELQNSPIASQRAAYQRGFTELFQAGLEHHARAAAEIDPSNAVYDSGLTNSERAARAFMPYYGLLNPVASPGASAALQAQSLQSALRYRRRLSDIGSGSTSASAQGDLADTVATLRQELKAREDELKGEKDSVDQLGKIADLRQQYLNKIQDAEEAYNLTLARAAQERAQAFAGNFSGLILSAQQGGSRGATGFLKGAATSLEGTVLQNFAKAYIYPALSKVIPTTGHSGGFLGTLLQGTAFGSHSDPLKLSTDLNTRATDLNTAAILGMAGALTGQPVSLPSMPSASLGTSGGTSSLSSALATFGSDTGGWTGSVLRSAGGAVSAITSLGKLFSGGGSASGGSYDGSAPPTIDPKTLQDLGIWDEQPPSSSAATAGTASAGGSLGGWAAVAGIAGAAAAGVKGIADITSSVPGRKVAGAGELAGAAGGAMSLLPLLGMSAALGPIGLGIAAVGGIVTALSSLWGVGPQDRQRDIQKNLAANTYMAPDAQNIMMGTNGGYADISENGTVRNSNLSPYPVVSQPYLDFPRRVVVPGHIISPFGGFSNQTGALVSPQTPSVNVTVHAMDSQSFIDNAHNIANAVNYAIQDNHSMLIQNIGQRLGVR